MSEPAPKQYRHATREEIARVDAALTATNGNRAHAARALGLDPRKVYDLVNDNPTLNAKWGVKDVEPVQPGLLAEIDRDKPVEPWSAGDVRVVKALDKQDALMKKGWDKIGFKPEEQEFLAGLSQMYAGNLKTVMDLSAGGAVHANTRLLLALEDVQRKLEDINAHPEKYRRTYMTEFGERESKGEHEYWHETYALFVSIVSELRKFGSEVIRANELRLKIEKLRMEREQDQRKQVGWGRDAKAAEKVS